MSVILSNELYNESHPYVGVKLKPALINYGLQFFFGRARVHQAPDAVPARCHTLSNFEATRGALIETSLNPTDFTGACIAASTAPFTCHQIFCNRRKSAREKVLGLSHRVKGFFSIKFTVQRSKERILTLRLQVPSISLFGLG